MLLPRTLAAKFVLIGSAFLAVALTWIGLSLWVSYRLEGAAAAVNEAGRLRMQTWRIAATLDAGDRTTTERLTREFDASLAVMRHGDASRPLAVPWDAPSRARFETVERDWPALRAAWLVADSSPAAGRLAQAERFAGDVDAFVDSVEHSVSAWTAILGLFQMAMVALAIGSALALLFVGHLVVLRPLESLRSGLASLQDGDLGTRIAVESRDEFGTLGEGFNRMAETLQGLYRNLEFKVREKTASLEVERERLSRLYEASAFLARATTLEEMTHGFVRQIRAISGADAAAIRWSDESNRRYVLVADDCLPHDIRAGERCLRTNECHCGQASETARTRVVPIRSDAASPSLLCAQAGFQSLISVPVVLAHRVLGEIDLFFRSPVELNDGERQHLDALASHLASAMEGLRAVAMGREAAVAQERTLLAGELHDSIAQSLAFLRIQLQLLRNAHKRSDASAFERSLEELEVGVSESTADVRELLLHFRTRTNNEHIEPALKTTLRKFEHQTGLRTQLSLAGGGLPLDPDIQVQVLHVVQEALSNVRKHAHANQVWIDVEEGAQWRVEVRDDGKGFDPELLHGDELHVGLRIMRERAERIGACVEVHSVPGAGSCVTLTMPAGAEALAA